MFHFYSRQKSFFFQGNTVPNNEVFINSFLISISALPGNIWTIFHMDKFGRKFFLGNISYFFKENTVGSEFWTGGHLNTEKIWILDI